MIIGVLKELSPETRVSLLPEHIVILTKWNVSAVIEAGAGINAFAPDEKYFRFVTGHSLVECRQQRATCSATASQTEFVLPADCQNRQAT